MTLSEPHPSDPFTKTGIKLGDYQFERAKQWKDKGILALLGLGVEPGMADVFAKYAATHLFDEIDEIGVRDGANLIVRGYDFAPNFSIWTTIEECLNPPVIWEKGKDWFTTAPFSEPEVFDFPEGIGKTECVNVEHEEVLLVPRYIKCNRVTFKYGLGDEFIGILKTLHMLGLDNKEPIKVKGCRSRSARCRGSLPARSCPSRSVHGRQDLRRYLDQRQEGWQGKTGLPLPGGGQQGKHGQVRLPGGGNPDRVQSRDRYGTAGERRLESQRCRRSRGFRPGPVHGPDEGVRIPLGNQGMVRSHTID